MHPQTTIRRAPVRLAFTLIEMLIASLLLVVLITTVTSVWRVLLSELRNSEKSPVGVLPENLARLLRRDVINARGYRQQGQQLDLVGYVAHDATSGQPLWTLAIASYQIRLTSQGGVLIRVQRWLAPESATTLNGTQVDLAQPLWRGATTIRLTSNTIDLDDTLTLPAVALQLLTSGSLSNEPGWLPLPPVVEITLLGEQGQALFRESIVRGEEI